MLYEVITANFTAGTHVVKIKAGSTSWTWNLDKITLERTGDMVKKGSVSNSENNFEVTIYPVPATDYFNVSGLGDGIYDVSIINMIGVVFV